MVEAGVGVDSVGACDVCARGDFKPFTVVSGVPYHRCDSCGSILADRNVLFENTARYTRKYDESYWSFEVQSSKDRSYGPAPIRVAEVFLLAGIPIERFIDISCGGGYLLDALSDLLPNTKDSFYGAEPFPPPLEFRSKHKNFHVGFVDDFGLKFDGGTCIEVIEHLFPDVLRSVVERIAASSNPGALYYFNSEQPATVIEGSFTYLDPYDRGHIASYSVEGLKILFQEYGFKVHEFPGRGWGFFAEYASTRPERETPFDRLWTPLGQNLDSLRSSPFGHLLHSAALDSIRCYLETATMLERTNWALRLDSELNQANQTLAQLRAS